MKLKEESEKLGLKFSIPKAKIMASGPITSWKIDGGTMETVTDFILEGSKITADGDHSHEIKRHLLLARKALINLDNVLKSRHHVADKGTYCESYSFSSSHVQIDSLTIKKAEHQRIDAFELCCWKDS